MKAMLLPVLPEVVLLTMACAILLVDLFLSDARRHVSYWLTQAALAACAWIAVTTMNPEPVVAFHGLVVDDVLSDFLKLASCVAVSLMLFYGRGYLLARGLFKGETFVLTLTALLGILVMVSANHFITLYMGLELQALSLYAMVAMHRASNAATEAAMKYFVLGALASGMLLYGMSMIYGATGSLQLDAVSQAIFSGRGNRVLLTFGLVFVVSGLAFKLGVVPYHMWVPDVYHGAATPVTLFIGTAPKLAAFAITLRLLAVGLAGLEVDWSGDAADPVDPVDDRRQPGGDCADQHQADARVLDDRQHGVPAARLRRRHAQRLFGGDVLRGGVRADQPGLVRRGDPAVARRLRGRPHRRLQGAEPALALVGIVMLVTMSAGRRAADRRLLRQSRRSRRWCRRSTSGSQSSR